MLQIVQYLFNVIKHYTNNVKNNIRICLGKRRKRVDLSIYIYNFFFRNCCLKCCVTFRLESSELIFQISPGCERKRVHIALRNRVVALV